MRPLGPFPVWVWGVGVALGLGVVWYVRTRSSASSSNSGGPGTLGSTPSGQQMPQYDYSGIDPFTGVPYTIEEQVNPNTGLPNYYNPQNPSTGGGQQATIRARNTSGVTSQYDTSTPQGVPFDVSPGQYESEGWVPYGAVVTISGAAVQGPSNFQHGTPQEQAVGSNVWYPIQYNGQSGYVSAFDLAGYSPSNGVQSGPSSIGLPSNPGGSPPLPANPPNPPGGIGHSVGGGSSQATPWWPVMTDLLN